MRKYVNKSLKKFYITSLKEQLLLKDVVSSLRSVVNATQEHHKLGAGGPRPSVHGGGGALGVNLSCSGETITGQQNMFSVGALEASFRKVDSNAADAIPFLPSSRPF